MDKNEIEAPSGRREQIVDWLGAQGPLLLTVYMCAIVALVAFLSDLAR